MNGMKGLIICGCRGNCSSFNQIDISAILSDLRREKIFDYTCSHEKLCSDGGREFLKSLLSGKEISKLFIAACDPDKQCQLLCDAFTMVDFKDLRYFAIDICDKTTLQAKAAIENIYQEILKDERTAERSQTAGTSQLPTP